jgi:small-conductance mechanosensitive channel
VVVTQFFDTLSTWLAIQILHIGNATLTLGHIISATLIILGFWLLSKLLQRAIHRINQHTHKSSAATIYTLTRISHYALMVIALIVASSALGISYDNLAIIAGALGVGVGFGLQSIVNNFISGLIILFEKSLKVGDFIELESGIVGEVIEINIRSTLIRTTDNIDVLVPNAEFINGKVTNWTLEQDIRRFKIPFGVAYGSDKNRVKEAVLKAALTVRHTLNESGHEPLVLMTSFGDSSLNFVLAVWVKPEIVKRPILLTSDYLWAIDDALASAGIEIPFPQRDIHIKTPPTKI